MASKVSIFFAELKRRKVSRVAAVYVIAGVAFIEAADLIFPRILLPDWTTQLVVIVVLLGFPAAVALAWAFEVKPEEPRQAEPPPEATAAAPDTNGRKSIVVLPFENLSSDPEQDFFVAGMHDALITELAQLAGLRVISRMSAMVFKDRRVSAPEIARELNVDNILEASVFREGDSIRIQAQLIEAVPTEQHLWAHTYDRELRDVFAMHSEVARAVARAVQVEMTHLEETRLASRPPVSPETYELYLKGMFHLNKFTPEGFSQGLAYLDMAVEKDPSEPLPHAGLALAYAIIGHTPNAPADSLPNAKEEALKALELDETLAEAHGALAEVRIYYDWDLEGAAQSYHRALELNPNLAETRGHYSWYLMLSSGMDDAIAGMRSARELNPFHPLFSAWLGWQLLWAKRHEEAMVEARRSIELDPDFPIGHYVLGDAYAKMGRFDEAIAAHKKAGALSPMWKWGLGTAYALAGREAEAREVARELEESLTQWDTWWLAEIYAALGETDEAIGWLEEALGQRHTYIPWLNRFPAFEPLRGDPRFQELARRGNAPA